MAETTMECKTCGDAMPKLGSFWACNNPDCDRFALPCHESHLGIGYTREEYAADAERDFERQSERQAEDYLTGFCRTEESPSYRSSLIDAGRGRLLS